MDEDLETMSREALLRESGGCAPHRRRIRSVATGPCARMNERIEQTGQIDTRY